MAAVGTLTCEQAQGVLQREFADGFDGVNYKTALDIGRSPPLASINRKPMERTSNINNNNIWGTSPVQEFNPDGAFPSLTHEQRCHDNFVDVNSAMLSTPSHYALNSTEWFKDFALEKSPPVDYAEPKSPKTTHERRTSVKGKESEMLAENTNMDALCALAKNEPLSLKERISNIDLSIEWLKCELTLMRAQDISLKQHFEQLFKEVMEFKLRMEMEKDEEEQFLEEEMSFEAESD